MLKRNVKLPAYTSSSRFDIIPEEKQDRQTKGTNVSEHINFLVKGISDLLRFNRKRLLTISGVPAEEHEHSAHFLRSIIKVNSNTKHHTNIHDKNLEQKVILINKHWLFRCM